MHFRTWLYRLSILASIFTALGFLFWVMWEEGMWLMNILLPAFVFLFRQAVLMVRPVVMSVVMRPVMPFLVLIGVAAIGGTWWGNVKRRFIEVTHLDHVRAVLMTWWQAEWTYTKIAIATFVFALLLICGGLLHIVVLYFPIGPFVIRSFYVRVSGFVVARIANPLFRYLGRAAKKNGYMKPVYTRLRLYFAGLVVGLRKVRRRLKRHKKVHPV